MWDNLSYNWEKEYKSIEIKNCIQNYIQNYIHSNDHKFKAKKKVDLFLQLSACSTSETCISDDKWFSGHETGFAAI